MYELENVKELLKQEALADNSLKSEDWENKEVLGDGTVVTNGCKNGELYAYASHNQIADYIDYCRQARIVEAEMLASKKDLWIGLPKWIMMDWMRLELMARGYPVDEMIAEGETKEFDKIYDTEWKEFKLTNMLLTGVSKRPRSFGVKGV